MNVIGYYLEWNETALSTDRMGMFDLQALKVDTSEAILCHVEVFRGLRLWCHSHSRVDQSRIFRIRLQFCEVVVGLPVGGTVTE